MGDKNPKKRPKPKKAAANNANNETAQDNANTLGQTK